MLIYFLIAFSSISQSKAFADQDQEIKSIISLNKSGIQKCDADIKIYEALQERALNGVVSSRAEKPIVIQPKGFPVLYKTEEIKRKDIETRDAKISEFKKQRQDILDGKFLAPYIFGDSRTKVHGLSRVKNEKAILVKPLETGRSIVQINVDFSGSDGNYFVVLQSDHFFEKRGQVIPCEGIFEFIGFSEVELTKDDASGQKVKVGKQNFPEITLADEAMEKIRMGIGLKK